MDALANYSKAEKEYKAGEKALKTGIFKKKPNYDEGMLHFQESAEIFEKLGKKEEAHKAFINLAECAQHSKIPDLYLAGVSYEKAAKYLYATTNDTMKTLALIKKSSEMYCINGTSSKGQAALRQFARDCVKEPDKIPLAIEIYGSLFTDLFTDENYLYGSDLIEEYITLLLNENKYSAVVDVEKAHIKYLKATHTEHSHLIRRAWLAAVSMYILTGEDYLVDEKMNEFLSDCEGDSTDEWRIAELLINAYRDRNKDKYLEVLRKPIFMQINIEIVKKLKKVNNNWEVIDKKAYKSKAIEKEINIKIKGLNLEDEVKEEAKELPKPQIKPPVIEEPIKVEDPIKDEPIKVEPKEEHKNPDDENEYGGMFQ